MKKGLIILYAMLLAGCVAASPLKPEFVGFAYGFGAKISAEGYLGYSGSRIKIIITNKEDYPVKTDDSVDSFIMVMKNGSSYELEKTEGSDIHKNKIAPNKKLVCWLAIPQSLVPLEKGDVKEIRINLVDARAKLIPKERK